MKHTHIIILTIFDWLAFLSIMIFSIALYSKYQQFILINANIIMITSSIFILIFFIIGRIIIHKLKSKSNNITKV